jgi:beta-lactamase superfamily II metal-dependent hydrolase
VPRTIAAAYTDRSAPNLSSIALYLRHGGRTALLTGDGWGDHLLSGLEAAGPLMPSRTIHGDVLKLPHHGSCNNAEPELFERFVPTTTTVHLTNPIPAARRFLAEPSSRRGFSV